MRIEKEKYMVPISNNPSIDRLSDLGFTLLEAQKLYYFEPEVLFVNDPDWIKDIEVDMWDRAIECLRMCKVAKDNEEYELAAFLSSQWLKFNEYFEIAQERILLSDLF